MIYPKALAGSLLLMCTLAPVEAREIAKRCAAYDAGICQYIFVDDVVKWGAAADGSGATVVGGYLPGYQNLVSPKEAPFKALRTKRGETVLFTLGFQDGFRMGGPIFIIYFIDSSGRVKLRAEGDLHLEAASLANLESTEFLVVCMRSETGISFTTHVWMLGGSAPSSVLEEAGRLDEIRGGDGRSPAGIALEVVAGEHPGTIFWRWDKRAKRFVANPAGRV